ncbi:hypothetical protein FOCC_FOCC006400, partial [Frankliniella occidentalis]
MAVYRSPSNPTVEKWNKFVDILQEALIKVDPLVNEVFVIGDFNVNLSNMNFKSKELLDLFDTACLSKLFNCYTRKNLMSGNDSAIDNIFSNSKNIISKNTLGNYGILDHEILQIKVDVSKPKVHKIFQIGRNLNEQNLGHLRIALHNEHWEDTLVSRNVNTAFDNFMLTLKYHLDTTCPILKTMVKPKGRKSNNVTWSNEIIENENLIALTEMALKLKGNDDVEPLLKNMKKYKIRLKEAYDISVKKS